ncbi:1-phosphofructokinase family hexose kinase [Cohnella zeiphila]|uniref:Tagatose-6-phosphate kinase n=1 Tax=Cohnella zeiphila TaxID=2761120 RepID=A0A7X0VU22_9BACL|nr:1-phosphofructokinase family hexose kinase [Cohnella zeiphila]MBB6729817.1 1-phosphofructokinase family hexose kinase [Cohnella zeiphila]
MTDARRTGKRITTVTLNAAIDKTYFVPALTPGKANRVARMIAQPGGKGINVASVAHLLGEEVTATGIVGGSTGDFIEKELAKQGICHRFVHAEGESRVCLNIVSDSGESVELLEPGLATEAEHYDRLMRMLEELADASSVIVLSGSLPAGAQTDIYRDIIERLKPFDVPVLLDTSGPALEYGAAASPYLIKPNEEEVAQLTGSSAWAGHMDGLADAIAALLSGGIRCVAVSLGDKGALVGMADGIYRVEAIPMQAVNPVGCGDAFLAGIAVGLHRGLPQADLFKLATACGASNALQPSAGRVDPAQVRAFAEIARVYRITD